MHLGLSTTTPSPSPHKKTKVNHCDERDLELMSQPYNQGTASSASSSLLLIQRTNASVDMFMHHKYNMHQKLAEN